MEEAWHVNSSPCFGQIESTAERVEDYTQINRTTTIDKAVGKDTFFVVTWQVNKPTITLRDPTGKSYATDEFDIDPNLHMARLRIPGIAQVILNYSFHLLLSGLIFARKS